ncbi:MAG: outer membrane beta-barrel protein [Proteobacteria bacterium]|nr:outer membrane beta-barrel protein [Pseudomonadota bacterium]
MIYLTGRPRLLTAVTLASLLAMMLPGSALAVDDFRLEVGLGIHGGDPDIEFAGVSGSLDTDTGIAISAAGWVDHVGWKHFSLGLEYLRLQDSDFHESASVVFLGGTLTGTLDFEPTIDAVMVNAAIRKNTGMAHPYIGGGIGLAHADADLTASATVTVGGQTFSVSGSANDTDTAFAGQLFGGMDVDIGGSWYFGVNARYFLMNADLFGADVEFRNWVVLGFVGLKF